MNIKFEIEYNDWFDYCPVDGAMPVNTNKDCLLRFKIDACEANISLNLKSGEKKSNSCNSHSYNINLQPFIYLSPAQQFL